MTLRLCAAALASADPTRVERPAYDRDAIAVGVVHLGPGGFHRAHQADYFDRLLARDPRWGICAASLKSRTFTDALKAQDGLYTLTILGEGPRPRIVGAIREAAMAHEPRVLAHQANPAIRLITLTVTEKGYCLKPDYTLDLDHPDIRHDMGATETARSSIGWLVRGLAQRKAQGGGGLTVMSCDNLPSNGRLLGAATLAFAAARGGDLARWIEDNVSFPCSMVDSITPAGDETLRAHVLHETGFIDAAPVQRERFTAWVTDAALGDGLPDLESVGVIRTTNVAGHEQAKLRMLNGAHSTLAYLGLAHGCVTVAGAMTRPDLSALINEMMANEIAPGLKAVPGLDLDDYRRTLSARFKEPAITHRLDQIAWDGSQKLPIRILATVVENLAAGRPIARLCLGVASWMRFVCRMARRGEAIVDPLAARLAEIGRACRNDPALDPVLFYERVSVIPPTLSGAPVFRAAIKDAYASVMAAEAAAASP